jgi:hypothetical protein
MGVACKRAGTIGCDKVGLAVWLPKRAPVLVAWIAGRRLRLHRAGVAAGRPFAYHGFLRHAGLRSGPLAVRPGRRVRPLVRITATYPNGSSASITVRVGLSPGWG